MSLHSFPYIWRFACLTHQCRSINRRVCRQYDKNCFSDGASSMCLAPQVHCPVMINPCQVVDTLWTLATYRPLS
jgi:hypothetical protein